MWATIVTIPQSKAHSASFINAWHVFEMREREGTDESDSVSSEASYKTRP